MTKGGTHLTELIMILKDILLPIFVIMGIEFFLQRKFDLNLQTLARLNIYFLVPGFIFVKLYSTEISAHLFGSVLFFFILYVILLFIIASFVGKLIGLDKGKKTTFVNSAMFFNSGNYGVPVNDLVFSGITFAMSIIVIIFFLIYSIYIKLIVLDKGKNTTFVNSAMFFNSGNYGVPVNDLVFRGDPFAMSIQVIMLTLQNIFLFSYGIFSLQSVKIGKLKAALGYFKMPVLYAMLSGVLLNYFSVPIPSFIWISANYISYSIFSLALFTLGAQVAQDRKS